MSRCPPWLRQGHGTAAATRRHYRLGEKPCPACLEAARLTRQRQEEVRRERIDPAVVPDMPALYPVMD